MITTLTSARYLRASLLRLGAFQRPLALEAA